MQLIEYVVTLEEQPQSQMRRILPYVLLEPTRHQQTILILGHGHVRELMDELMRHVQDREHIVIRQLLRELELILQQSEHRHKQIKHGLLTLLTADIHVKLITHELIVRHLLLVIHDELEQVHDPLLVIYDVRGLI